HQTELKTTLGDGFLYETSPIFRNVRDNVKASGYKIISELSEESRDFFMTSVFQFEKIILEKKLFARQNAEALRYLARKCHNLSMQVNEVSLSETYSSLFHESIHCIFADRFGWKSLLLKDHADQKTYIEQIFTAESAALAFEYILCATYHDPCERSLVFLNALGYQDAESLEAYRALERMCGLEVAALWLFRGYFASNYFYEAFLPPPGLFQTVYNKCVFEGEKLDKAVGHMEIVFSIGFSLNKGFRNGTASGFFKMIGLKGNLKNAFQFDLFEILNSQAWATGCYLDVLKEMSHLNKLRASV
ncbi:MAG: hypothetical protein K2P92_05450, partial [Bdellovibrionaceae bacterium]|nr:hypothetical protein [Pseudobdellovibrionaceae bacterium]